MKTFFRKLILRFLHWKARKILRSNAKIIAVTGSMGKTTTKEAIAHLLHPKYKILVASEGFNTELGVLLTLVGETESGFSAAGKWLQILWRVWWKKLEIPEVIILEFGVDRPGDMEKLLQIVQPHYAIVTSVAPVHLGAGQFQNVAEIAAEKMKLPHSLPANGIAFLNYDNEHIRKNSEAMQAEIVSYGQGAASARIDDLRQEPEGIRFQLLLGNESAVFSAPFFGSYHVSVLAPAILLAREFGIAFAESAGLLKDFTPPPGRGRILPGIHDSVIWDSSYNSGPVATTAALKTLPEIPAKRRLALLGNMNELGKYSAKFHEELGQTAAEYTDEIFFVGAEYAAFAKGVGKKKPWRRFENAAVAGEYLTDYLRAGDLLLVKGSQNGIFLERAVKKILRNPEDQQFLCRQGEEWERK